LPLPQAILEAKTSDGMGICVAVYTFTFSAQKN
jgi:hypothetical protein